MCWTAPPIRVRDGYFATGRRRGLLGLLGSAIYFTVSGHHGLGSPLQLLELPGLIGHTVGNLFEIAGHIRELYAQCTDTRS
jgi:hypothetical protein